MYINPSITQCIVISQNSLYPLYEYNRPHCVCVCIHYNDILCCTIYIGIYIRICSNMLKHLRICECKLWAVDARLNECIHTYTHINSHRRKPIFWLENVCVRICLCMRLISYISTYVYIYIYTHRWRHGNDGSVQQTALQIFSQFVACVFEKAVICLISYSLIHMYCTYMYYIYIRYIWIF